MTQRKTTTVPKHILRRRRAYFGSIRKEIKRIFSCRGELKCVVCEAESHLELHHILPLSMGGNNDIGNLMVLCHGHHKEIHNGKREAC